MRLRNITGSRDMVRDSSFTVDQPEQHRGAWASFLGSQKPLYIEIGTGKGQFLLAMAQKHPEMNFIGIEKYSSVLIRALDKAREQQPENVRFIRMDAEYIEEVFGEREVDKIFLNFSDPWPKDRHAKRRLTSPNFLNKYNIILKEQGTIEFKTDNRDLFLFSLESIRDTGWILDAATWDLHRDAAMNAGNIMTEYEKKFSGLGHPICKCIAHRIRY